MNLHSRIRPAGASCVAALLALTPALFGQAPQPQTLDQQDFANAEAHIAKQEYEEALKLLRGIPNKYPSSGLIPSANWRIAYIQYVQDKHDDAIATLFKNINAKTPPPPEVLELSYYFLPQVAMAKAVKMPENDPRRKGTLEEALRYFDDFIKKFPQSPEVEASSHGKARALLLLDRYEDAATVLRETITKFPNSEQALDTQVLLGRVLAALGAKTLKTATLQSQRDEADKHFAEAEKAFNTVISKRTDYALLNESNFQLGEIYFTRAGFAEKADKKEELAKKAIDFYRRTGSKEQVIAAQEARIKQFEARRMEAFRGGKLLEANRLKNLIDRENGKLAEFQGTNDRTLDAKLRSGQLFITLPAPKPVEYRYDEARILLKFVDQFIEDKEETKEQRKQIDYFLTVTYAAQHVADKATELYEAFIKKYNNDPIAENLPLLMGMIYLDPNPKLKDPEKAIKYFEEQAERYPDSKFTADATAQKAQALIELQRFDEAEKVLDGFLSGSPTEEQRIAAEFSKAVLFMQRQKLDDALNAFRGVRDRYAGSPQAEASAYYYAQLMLQKGDAKGALEEIKSFIARFPNSDQLPQAYYLQASAQNVLGNKEDALRSFAELGEKFPDSEPAVPSFFQRAVILQGDGKMDESVKVLREFLQKFPETDKLYAAFDYMAQQQVALGNREAAVKAYQEMIQTRPTDPSAPRAYLNISRLYKEAAEKMGAYLNLSQERRQEWEKNINACLENGEKLIAEYPESAEVALALQNLLWAQQARVKAKIEGANVRQYFNGLANKFEGNAAAKSKIQFTVAGFLIEQPGATDKDKEDALAMMREAFNPDLIYAPADLDRFGSAVIQLAETGPAGSTRNELLEEAGKIFGKLAKDYPVPAGTPKERVPRVIAEAHAISIWGEGQILQIQGKNAEAQAKFEVLKKDYSWSPKLAEADLGIALGLFEKKEYDKATEILRRVSSNTLVPPRIRAKAMYNMARIQEDTKKYEDAINNYVKIPTFFESVPDISAEALWRGAQLQEAQGTGKIARPTPVPKAKPGDKKARTEEPAPKQENKPSTTDNKAASAGPTAKN